MYRELHPLRQALAREVSATLPCLPGIERTSCWPAIWIG